jgi:two-component system, NtrC family, response regulator AtoC
MQDRIEVMIVEDDSDGREYVEKAVRSFGYWPTAFEGGAHAVQAVSTGYTPSIALLDMMMPEMNGIEVLTHVKAMSPTTVGMMLSAVDRADPIVHAVKAGAYRYLVKPVSADDLRSALEGASADHAIEKRLEAREAGGQKTAASDIISGDAAMIRLQAIARRVADTDVPVLITGESGVGKEVLARFLHAHSERRNRAFVKVNCAALPHDLLESELFGHEKGAFTGAVADRAGRFEMADKGTIFLDEIGDMSPALQAKLLHVLQDGEFSRVGGRAVKVDARVIAATNKPLEEAVRRREFREDLYYRLDVVRMKIPPLRERPGDVPRLAEVFCAKFAAKYKSKRRELPAAMMQELTRHRWPGNVRELENCIKRYVVLSDMDLPLHGLDELSVRAPAAHGGVSRAPTDGALKDAVRVATEQIERDLALRVLQETGWNRKETARRLGICYKSLLNKLKKWEVRAESASI